MLASAARGAEPREAGHPSPQVAEGLRRAAETLRSQGIAVPTLAGKLLRPVVAWALVRPEARAELDERFWLGTLAVQMVHEASLLHDDVLDGAAVRRGRATVAAVEGVGAALALGDHYLTGAYRAAAATGSATFLDVFIRAVERTVAGEIEQGARRGRRLDREGYLSIVRGKSGELFGAAAALSCAFSDADDVHARVEFGRALGALYQKVDDLLDFCPAAVTGKPPLQDYRQRKWTWVLDEVGLEDFSRDETHVLEALFRARGESPSPARGCLAHLRAAGDHLARWAADRVPGDTIVAGVVDAWVRAAERGVRAQEEALDAGAASVGPEALPGIAMPREAEIRSPDRTAGSHPHPAETEVAEAARRLGGPERWADLFGHHARTFRFAARLFPPEKAALVRGLYAFCRFTDDLVDEAGAEVDPSTLRARLDAWAGLSRQAFEGTVTGIPLLDSVVGEAGRRGVSWRYPDALLGGVAMDVTPVPYPDWDRLEAYTFGVAGAVGGWMTQLFDLDDPELLECAHALGHAMQLTNIVRDVGEDLERGRLYLPVALLQAHGLDRAVLERVRSGCLPIPDAYRRVLDAVMVRADAWYAQAWPGIRRLPAWYRRPVAVAAEAYRGIQREVRRQGYDNLRWRAHTSLGTKLVLAARGLARSRT